MLYIYKFGAVRLYLPTSSQYTNQQSLCCTMRPSAAVITHCIRVSVRL